MFGTVQNVAVFFSDSPKRMAFLQDAIRESTPDSRWTKLSQHCQTRWIEQGDALVVFIELYDAVIHALEKISISCDGKTGSSATELLVAVSKFSFLAALMSAEFVLHYTKPLSLMLQKSGLDLCQAMHEVKTTQTTLNDVRVNGDKWFKEIYYNIVKIASISGTEPSVPRTCGRQTMRTNISTNNPVVYYRQSVFISFLDNMIQGFEERFSPRHSDIALASKLMPSVMLKIMLMPSVMLIS